MFTITPATPPSASAFSQGNTQHSHSEERAAGVMLHDRKSLVSRLSRPKILTENGSRGEPLLLSTQLYQGSPNPSNSAKEISDDNIRYLWERVVVQTPDDESGRRSEAIPLRQRLLPARLLGNVELRARNPKSGQHGRCLVRIRLQAPVGALRCVL
ncbi:hypothetical protein PG984_001651 [Apiospora sp. TS-2023a]